MPSAQKITLNLKYTLKPDARDAEAELKTILDLCALEPEFITAILQDTPERPNELILFELWRGSHEDFIRVQGPRLIGQITSPARSSTWKRWMQCSARHCMSGVLTL